MKNADGTCTSIGFVDFADAAAAQAAIAALNGYKLPDGKRLFLKTKNPAGSGKGKGKDGKGKDGKGKQLKVEPTLAAFAERVKAMQRADPRKWTLWSEYCDAEANGTKDPHRHTMESLQTFIENCT